MTMTLDTHAQAWADYWSDAASTGTGCLPDGVKSVENVQAAAWKSFAAQLPNNAQLLDLATGDGRVMSWIIEARPDVTALGIDYAPQLPNPPKGTKTMCGISMESLPLETNSVDAVTSQFGIEYSNLDRAAAELARVLKPQGKVGLLMHHPDSPIVAHNVQRSEAIRWVLNEAKIIDRAKQILESKADGRIVSTTAIAEISVRGTHQFGQNSPAWEIAEAVRLTVHSATPKRLLPAERMLNMILSKARAELARIDALRNAVSSVPDTEIVIDTLSTYDLKPTLDQKLQTVGEDNPFATFCTFQPIG